MTDLRPARRVSPWHIVLRELHARAGRQEQLNIWSAIVPFIERKLAADLPLLDEEAKRLADLFTTSKELWLRLELDYREGKGQP